STDELLGRRHDRHAVREATFLIELVGGERVLDVVGARAESIAVGHAPIMRQVQPVRHCLTRPIVSSIVPTPPTLGAPRPAEPESSSITPGGSHGAKRRIEL